MTRLTLSAGAIRLVAHDLNSSYAEIFSQEITIDIIDEIIGVYEQTNSLADTSTKTGFNILRLEIVIRKYYEQARNGKINDSDFSFPDTESQVLSKCKGTITDRDSRRSNPSKPKHHQYDHDKGNTNGTSNTQFPNEEKNQETLDWYFTSGAYQIVEEFTDQLLNKQTFLAYRHDTDKESLKIQIMNFFETRLFKNPDCFMIVPNSQVSDEQMRLIRFILNFCFRDVIRQKSSRNVNDSRYRGYQFSSLDSASDSNPALIDTGQNDFEQAEYNSLLRDYLTQIRSQIEESSMKPLAKRSTLDRIQLLFEGFNFEEIAVLCNTTRDAIAGWASTTFRKFKIIGEHDDIAPHSFSIFGTTKAACVEY